MKSNTTLVIEENATLKGSKDESGDYPIIDSRFNGTEQKCYASLINAIDAHNITITGKGVVAGSGIGGSRAPSGPRVIEFIRCKDVLLENIKVTNKGRWTIHPLYCTNVIIRGLNIETTGSNSDGIDPDSCNKVLITECTFKTGDDCIAIKSGRNQQGVDVGIPCENITITNCTMLGGYGAVCIGSEMSGGIRNVLIKDCVIKNNGTGFNIKSRKGRGGVVENIELSNIEMHNVNSPIVIQMNYRFNAGDLIPGPDGIPTFRNITIKDLTIHGNRMGAIHGIEESPIDGLTLKNIKCDGNGSLDLNYVQGLTFDNIQNKDGGIALILKNTELKK
jgi:polygalacturonase